jgi:hypothetical protein
MPFPKIVESSHYHIWTDALHSRELARQAVNRWDRGTYVRWSITTGWTALEMACEQALETTGIGRRFKDNLNEAIQAKKLPPLNWGIGVWQELLEVHKLRKNFVHINLDQEKLFPETVDAEKSLRTLRNAIKEIFVHAGKNPPEWVEDDQDRGWDTGKKSFINLTVTRAGANINDPACFKVAYIHKDKECITEILPPNADYMPVVETLLKNIKMPITSIIVYRGNEIVFKRELKMRGA